jgi:SAM-dependent methyltransferase
MIDGQAFQTVSDRLKLAWFHARGSRPFTTGYRAHKEQRIRHVLDRDGFNPEQLPPGYGLNLDERIVEYPWLLAHLPPGPGVLLDAGSALNFRFLLSRPALSAKTIYICTLAPERHSFWDLGVSYTFQDLRRTCFRDGFFDYVVSLSTLEHIGLDNGRFYADQSRVEYNPNSYVDALQEMARVLRPGGRCFLTVPYGRHMNLGWLQVFDGPMLDRVVEAFAPRSVLQHMFRYTPEGWRVTDARDAAGATYVDLHTARDWHRGLPVAAEAVACLVLTK